MKRILAFLLAAVCMAAFMISCTRRKEPDEDCVYVSDGEGNRGVFSVKEKKCSFKDSDIVVLYVKNNTENEYTVTVNGSFFTSDGKEASAGITKSKTIFSGLEICCVFRPNTQFDRFEYQISSVKKEKTSECSFDYYPFVSASYGPNPVDVNEGHEQVRVDVCFNVEFESNFPYDKKINGTIIFFDNNGEIYWICEDYVLYSIPGTQYKSIGFTIEDILWDEQISLPDNLKGSLEVAFDYDY